jgi:hypothetical protein
MALSCRCERCEAVRSSAAYVIVSPDLNELDTALLYLAISLDKPIVLVTLPGCKVPDKLAKVVDLFVEMTPGMQHGQLTEAVKAALVDLGVVPDDAVAVRGYDLKPSQN